MASPIGITTEQRQQMRDEYDAGATLRQVAQTHGVAFSTANYHVNGSRGGTGRHAPAHGTQLGWLTHTRHATPPCPACTLAHRAWTTGLTMPQEPPRA